MDLGTIVLLVGDLQIPWYLSIDLTFFLSCDCALSSKLNALYKNAVKQGWTNPDAEVHLVLRHHGAAVEEAGFSQITNVLDPYCSDPLILYEGEKANGNICSDKQDVIVMAGESGELPVHEFGTGTPIEGARTIVNRRGNDLIQFILETHVVVNEPSVPVAPKSAQTEMPKSAVTVWWVIFNNPAACTTNPEGEIKCGSADLVPETDGCAIWAAGDVADDHGKLFLTSGLYKTVDPLMVDEGIDFKGVYQKSSTIYITS